MGCQPYISYINKYILKGCSFSYGKDDDKPVVGICDFIKYYNKPEILGIAWFMEKKGLSQIIEWIHLALCVFENLLVFNSIQ